MKISTAPAAALIALYLAGCSSDPTPPGPTEPPSVVTQDISPAPETDSDEAAQTSLNLPTAEGEIARSVADGTTIESLISDQAPAGATLTVRFACRLEAGADMAQAEYAIQDANSDKGSEEDNTSMSRTFDCNGEEQQDQMPAPEFARIQIVLTEIPEGAAEAYAVVSVDQP